MWDREVADVADRYRSLRVVIRQPAEPPRGANGGVRRSNFDALALGEQLLAGFPHRFEGVNQPQDRAVALDQRPAGVCNHLVQGGERRRSLVEAPL
jgi:hypothetical protein